MADDGHDTPPANTERELPELGGDREADSESIPVGEEPAEGSGTSGSSSTIQLGTGQSGVVSDDWSLPPGGDDDAEHEENDPPSVGTFEIPEGLVPDLDNEFGSVEAADAGAGDDGDDIGSEFSEFAEIDNPEMAADLIGETSQDELPGSWGDDEATEPAAGPGQGFGSQAAPPRGLEQPVRVGLRPRPLRKKSAAGSLAGVVIGGLLAVPIVVVILLWGFRRDDFGIARVLPEELAFLLPAELRPLPRLPQETPSAEPMPTLPPDGFAGLAPGSTSAGDRPVVPGQDAVSPQEMRGVVGSGDFEEEPRSPEDVLLDAADLALLEMATARATVMLGSMLDLPSDAPEEMLKAARIDWYKSLAAVGEEAAAAEGLRMEGGRSTAAVAGPVISLAERIARDPVATEELAVLARQWMLATKRDSSGVLFPGELQDIRQIGTVWASSLQSSGEDAESNRVTVLSQRRPERSEGSRVVAAGVIVAKDVIWAAAWADLPQPPDAPGDAAPPTVN